VREDGREECVSHRKGPARNIYTDRYFKLQKRTRKDISIFGLRRENGEVCVSVCVAFGKEG
jgi:hypothetical protein